MIRADLIFFLFDRDEVLGNQPFDLLFMLLSQLLVVMGIFVVLLTPEQLLFLELLLTNTLYFIEVQLQLLVLVPHLVHLLLQMLSGLIALFMLQSDLL